MSVSLGEMCAVRLAAVINAPPQWQAPLSFYVLSLGNICFSKPNVACVVLKSAVTSHYFLFFFFLPFLAGPGKEVKGQLAQHQSHQSASVTNYY